MSAQFKKKYASLVKNNCDIGCEYLDRHVRPTVVDQAWVSYI